MAVLVLKDVKVTINSVNLSDHITSVSLKSNYDILETAGFSSTSKSRIAGLVDNQCTFEFNQDFASANVEATLYPLLGSTCTVVVSPLSTSTGIVANPSYTFTILVSEWASLDGKIGDLAVTSASFPITGAITKLAV